MSIQAYRKAVQTTADPRNLEHQLFSQVTAALIEAQDAGREDLRALSTTLDWNRRLWSTLALDCSNPDNSLPDALKAGIISLSLFVSRYSSQVMRKSEDMSILIEINRAVMEGLAGDSG